VERREPEKAKLAEARLRSRRRPGLRFHPPKKLPIPAASASSVLFLDPSKPMNNLTCPGLATLTMNPASWSASTTFSP